MCGSDGLALAILMHFVSNYCFLCYLTLLCGAINDRSTGSTKNNDLSLCSRIMCSILGYIHVRT